MDPLNVPYFHFRWVLKLLTWHKCHCSHPVHIRDSNHTHCLTSLQESRLLANGHPYRALAARNGGPTWPEDRFLSPFVHRRREIAHPGLTKGFLQVSPEAAMLPGHRVETHPPLPVPPFLLARNLSPKDIARSDITSWKLYDANMRPSHIIN